MENTEKSEGKEISKKNLPAKLSDIVCLPAVPENQDPWFSLPEASREKAYKLMDIVNGAREIQARSKKKGKGIAFKNYADQRGINPKTLYRHIKNANDALDAARKSDDDIVFAQVKALTPGFGKNKNKFRSWEDDALFYAASEYLNQKHLNISDIYAKTVQAGIANGWRPGSYDSLLGILKRLDKATCTLARKGNKKFEADCQIKILRDYTEIWPNFMWVGDHHQADAFVKLPDGKGGWLFRRPWLTAWMDMASRSFVGWCISMQPNSQTIAMALAHGISQKNDPNFPQHGLPNTVYVDNGKDYRCKYLNGEEIEIGKIDYPEIIDRYSALGIAPFYLDFGYDPDQKVWIKKRGQKELIVKGIRVGGVYGRLGIGQRYATAYHPWAKPIERAFRTVVQRFSRNLPGACGSNPKEKSCREEKLSCELKRGEVLTIDEFCSAWFDFVTNGYHKTPHRGHGMNGMTPDQAFTSRLPKPTKVEPKLLDFALMKKERVKIYNWGFNLNSREFELDISVSLYGGYVANKVIGGYAQVLFDYDYKTVRVYRDGEYICDGKPLNRASFLKADDPVMIEKLKLQSYQKKASKGILKIIQEQAGGATGTCDEALLRLTHGGSSGITSLDSQRASVQDECDENDKYMPISEHERYTQIIRRTAKGKELSLEDQDFKTQFESTQMYLRRKDLYNRELEYLISKFQKRSAAL